MKKNLINVDDEIIQKIPYWIIAFHTKKTELDLIKKFKYLGYVENCLEILNKDVSLYLFKRKEV